MITTPVILAVLAAAVMHAGWNFMVKQSSDRLLDTTVLALGGSVLAALLLPWAPPLAPESHPWLAVSVVIHIAYFVLLIRSYQHADLSVVYPLMRGLAPVLIALAAPFLGESYSFSLLLGVGLVGLGIIFPALMGLRRGWVARAGLVYAVLNAVVIACYTMVDGFGVRLSGSSLAYTLWLFLFDSWGILLIMVLYRRKNLLTLLARRWRYGLAGSVLSVGSYGLVLWAMTVAPIPVVAALRETSVIFATLLGIVFLKEKMGWSRLGGASLIVLGAMVIRLGG